MLCIDDLHKVLKATWEARAKWYNCGLALGLTAGTLDATEKSCQSKCDDCFREILKEWLQKARPSPSWIALCIALEDPSVGHDELAENLEFDATHGVKQTACLCLVRMLQVSASSVPIDQYANKIVQLLNEK